MIELIHELMIDEDSKAVRRGVTDLKHIGVRPDGMLLVHSSFRSVRSKAKSIENVVASLALSLGANGTLLLPTLTYNRVTPKNPVFDISLTPSNVGAIPEFYRKRSVTKRSVHPTHSVCAYGAQAGNIISGHELDRTPVGPNSPFSKLRKANGQLLMLGCGLKPNTSMHGIEELAKAPYVFGPSIAYTFKDNGVTIAERTYTAHGFGRWHQRYDRITKVLQSPNVVRGRVFGAEAWLIEVSALWETCKHKIEAEPFYFVDRIG